MLTPSTCCPQFFTLYTLPEALCCLLFVLLPLKAMILDPKTLPLPTEGMMDLETASPFPATATRRGGEGEERQRQSGVEARLAGVVNTPSAVSRGRDSMSNQVRRSVEGDLLLGGGETRMSIESRRTVQTAREQQTA